MSLQDEDEQTSECCADINNNMNSTQDEETFLMNEKSEDSQQQEDGEAFFRDLFNVYDVDRVGYILVENFIHISKQNMFESFLGDDEKLKAFVELLDPKGTGHIDYFGFVNGMSNLMSGNTESYMEGHSLISRSRGSTFMEGETPVLQSENNADMLPEEEIFESYETNTNTNSSDKTSSNEYEFHENDAESIHEEGTDYFGLDDSLVQNHRKSLSVRKSISMGGLVRNSKRLSMHTLNDSAFNNHSYEEDRVNGDNSERYEQLVEELEFKVKNLEIHNQTLKHEIDEQIEKNKFQAAENSGLIVKIQEFEDHNLELERRFQIQIQEENARHQEALNKIYLQQQIDTENYLSQIRMLEIESQEQNLENENNRKRIDELIEVCENKESKLNEEYSKMNEITAEHKQTVKQLETLMVLNEQQKLGYEEQIDQYKKEIYETKLQLEDSHQEYCQERKSTMYDESYYLNQIAQLEGENKLFKSEMAKLNENIGELEANIKIYKSSIQDDDEEVAFGNHGIPSSISQESFLSEITSSKDNDLLQTLVDERKNSQRLREYIEELTSKILEHNPAILEAKIMKVGSSPQAQTPKADKGKVEIQILKPSSTNTTPRRDSKADSKFNYKRLLKLVN